MEIIQDNQWPVWEVFVQSQNGSRFKHAGSVRAPDKVIAMRNARDTYCRRNEGNSLWLVPSQCIVASEPSDSDMLFDPSNDKVYRHPTFYTMPEGALNI